jgi:glycosyl hydrolase family 26
MFKLRGALDPTILVVAMMLLVALSPFFIPQARRYLQEPVNRKASAKTRQVLRLLYELPKRPDHKVISGQVLRTLDHDPNYPADAEELSRLFPYPDVYDRIRMIHDQTGYWVGIAGAEYSDWGNAARTQNQRILSSELNPHLIAHSQRGGIVMLHWHPWSPKTGLSGTTEVIHHDADELLNPGPIHDNWMRLLNDAAAGLRELRDNNVVVLWRPMHGNNLGWWWSTLGQKGYRRVWAHMVDYFSNTCSLDNVLYFQSWYPVEGDGRKYAGGDIVDIVGMDGIPTDPITPPGLWDSLRAFGKPIAVSEGWVPEGTTPGGFDTRTIIEGIKRLAPRVTFFVQFDHPTHPKNHLAANLFARELLSDPWVVNAPIFDSLQRK